LKIENAGRRIAVELREGVLKVYIDDTVPLCELCENSLRSLCLKNICLSLILRLSFAYLSLIFRFALLKSLFNRKEHKEIANVSSAQPNAPFPIRVPKRICI
jgi:hypothetical protein